MKKHSNTVFSFKAQSSQASLLLALSTSVCLANAAQAAPQPSEAKPFNLHFSKTNDALLMAKSSKKSDKPASKTPAGKDDKPDNKAEAKPTPQPPIENIIDVTTNQLVDKPQDFLNKNVKFTAKFFAYTSLALDYKPAMRSSRTNLSFLVLRPDTHTPFAELKLAMALPKEKDPETMLLASLKDGDQIEVIGKVFATPLDEPWLDVLRLKKLSSASDDKDKNDKKLSANETDAIKKEQAGQVPGVVRGNLLKDKGSAFPPDSGSKGVPTPTDTLSPAKTDAPSKDQSEDQTKPDSKHD